MKKVIRLTTAALLLTCLATAAAAQESARDLYLSYNQTQGQGQSQTPGRPGTKMTIELRRNGKVSWVSPNATFRSGDEIKFHFTTNFSGYVAILQQGSTGNRSILFPNRGADNRVRLNVDNVIPAKRDDWIVFDRHPGVEKLTFIMSKNPLKEIEMLSTILGQPNSGGGGGQVVAGSAEEQQILNELNNRALDGSRDLSIQTVGGSAYAVASEQNIGAPVRFILNLTHR
jgi:hypothetical protein